jgi:hypothetical protein
MIRAGSFAEISSMRCSVTWTGIIRLLLSILRLNDNARHLILTSLMVSDRSKENTLAVYEITSPV